MVPCKVKDVTAAHPSSFTLIFGTNDFIIFTQLTVLGLCERFKERERVSEKGHCALIMMVQDGSLAKLTFVLSSRGCQGGIPGESK